MDASAWIAGHWALAAGSAAAMLALAAWLGDHRRARRTDLDRVGFVPWTDVFFWATMAAVLLLGWGLKEMFAG
jgi:hypothetical protein